MLLPPIILIGLAVAGIAYVFVDMMTCKRIVDPHLGRFEVQRRSKLREVSNSFKWFEPWVDELSKSSSHTQKDLDAVHQHLLASGNTAPWKSEEFLATKRIEAVFAACLGALLGWGLGGLTMSLLFAVLLFFLYQAMAKRLLK